MSYNYLPLMNYEDLHLIIDGDKETYSDLYREYFKKFFNYGKKFTTDTFLIEDSIQEVFLDLYANKERLAKVGSANSYLFSSFRYTLLRNIKQRSKIVSTEDVETEPLFSIDQIIIDNEIEAETRLKLKKALDTLTPHQQEAILLRFYYHLSYEEVASILNISVKATYKLMSRSLLSLKQDMIPFIIWLLLSSAQHTK